MFRSLNRRSGPKVAPAMYSPPARPIANPAAGAAVWNSIFGRPAMNPQGRRPSFFAPFRAPR